MAEPSRVLIVEDHAVMADGLALMLERQPDLQVVGIAGTAAEAIRLARETRPDVLLLDYHLPDGDGAQVTAAVCDELPATAVIVLTADTSEDTLLAAVEAGVAGFLGKEQPSREVLAAVRRAAQGEMLIPAATLAALLRQRRQPARPAAAPLGALTAREREVLRLVAEGLDNRAIAERLVLSLATVHGYVQQVREKLGAHSKLQAVIRASALGLLDQPPR